MWRERAVTVANVLSPRCILNFSATYGTDQRADGTIVPQGPGSAFFVSSRIVAPDGKTNVVALAEGRMVVPPQPPLLLPHEMAEPNGQPDE